MTKFELTVAVLAGIALVGLIVLLALGRDVTVLTPVLAALVSFVLGSKKDAIVAGIRRSK